MLRFFLFFLIIARDDQGGSSSLFSIGGSLGVFVGRWLELLLSLVPPAILHFSAFLIVIVCIGVCSVLSSGVGQVIGGTGLG